MKTLLLIIALLPGTATAAEKPKKSPQPNQAKVNPCAHHGAGFVQLKGTKTCVKLSGYVRTEIGR